MEEQEQLKEQEQLTPKKLLEEMLAPYHEDTYEGGLPPLEELGDAYIKYVRNKIGGNISGSARILKINRATIYRKSDKDGTKTPSKINHEDADESIKDITDGYKKLYEKYKDILLTLYELEGEYMRYVYKKNGGNIRGAARDLGIDRATIYRRFKKDGTQIPRQKSAVAEFRDKLRQSTRNF